MAFARVVSFDGVDSDHAARNAQQIEADSRPDEIPASEILLLHDPDAQRALAILFFDTEDDYRRGDATLDAMDPGDTPGRRTSVAKYSVMLRKAV